MSHRAPRNLPWLEQLAIHIPGYGGYLDRGNRRAADRALRDAIAQRLETASARLQEMARRVLDRDAQFDSKDLKRLEAEDASSAETQKRRLLTEVSAIERVQRHLERIIQRVRAAGSGTDAFYNAGNLKPAEADSLHAFDLALFERAEAILDRFDAPDLTHDFLAELEADLKQFDQKLDDRAMLLQGVR